MTEPRVVDAVLEPMTEATTCNESKTIDNQYHNSSSLAVLQANQDRLRPPMGEGHYRVAIELPTNP